MLGTVVTVVASIATLAYWLGKKFGEIEHKFEIVDKKIDETNKRIDRLTKAYTAYQELFIELLTGEGVLRAEKAPLAKGELYRIVKLGPAAISRSLHTASWRPTWRAPRGWPTSTKVLGK